MRRPPFARLAAVADVDWQGRLWWGPGRLAYLGPGGPATEHRHHAVQVVMSFDGPVSFDVEGRKAVAPATIIPSGARHAVDSTGRTVLLLLTEPQGPAGAGLALRAAELAGHDISGLLPADPGSADEIVAALDPVGFDAPPASPAVLAALAYLDGAVGGRPRLAEAARAANLSPSRLTHVFTHEVGIPFRRYVLWLRLRRAVGVAGDATVAEAAARAGFSDQAHLTRVTRQTFGVSPTIAFRMTVEESTASFKPQADGRP
jgi:AraC-like DNA-binding protein